MNENESYLVLRFRGTANESGEVAISIPFPLNGPVNSPGRKFTKVSIKTETPCNPVCPPEKKPKRTLDLTIESSDFGVAKFLYLDPRTGIDPFDKRRNKTETGRATGKFRDCDQCIIPFDTCPESGYPPPDVRPPYDVNPAVEGTLFLIKGSLSGFDPNTTVSGFIAAGFE